MVIFILFWPILGPHAPQKLLKTVVNINVDVWEEKYDISFKDRSIFLSYDFFHNVAGTFSSSLYHGIYVLGNSTKNLITSTFSCQNLRTFPTTKYFLEPVVRHVLGWGRVKIGS